MTGQVFAPGKGLGISRMSVPFRHCRSPSFLTAPTPARSACRVNCCVCERRSASKHVSGAEERPQLLRHAAAIACIGAHALLPPVVPCSPVLEHITVSLQSINRHILETIDVVQGSCSWLALYGLTSNLAHSRHHPQVKLCFMLQSAGTLSWPLLEGLHLSCFCSHTCHVHPAGEPAMSCFHTAATVMQRAPQVRSQRPLRTTRLGW